MKDCVYKEDDRRIYSRRLRASIATSCLLFLTFYSYFLREYFSCSLNSFMFGMCL